MKYKLIGKNDYLIEPIKTILNNRGIVDIDKFLNVNESMTHHWSLLSNIKDAANCLIKHLEQDSVIFVQIDSDCDGLSSSAILINYLKRTHPKAKIKWRLQQDKTHGIVLDTVPEETGLVIVPDAGSNQYEIHKQLKDRGIDVIVLDHHHCERESDYAIVVNNQLSPEYPNKNFSGAGIVYKFCKVLDEILNVDYADYFLDLVAVGNIADSMDMREFETRYYVLKGLKQINNPFLKALIEKQEYSMKGIVNITNVSFYIAPLINAVVRSGTMEEKEAVFKCLTESDDMVYYKRRDTWESIHTNTARQLANVRARQNKLRDKGVELIQQRIEEKNLNKNKILIVNVTGILETTLTGLVANRLVDRYKKPVLLLRQQETDVNSYGGSGRGYEKSEIKDFRQFLLNTGKFEFCEGHNNAFGFGIHKDKIIEANDYINELLKDIDMGSDVYDVDLIVPASQLNRSLVDQLNKMRDLWGFKVQEPLLAIKNVPFTQEVIRYPEKEKGTVVLKYKDIEFIKYQADSDIQEQLRKYSSFKMTLVGRVNENIWNDKVTPQIIIDDFEVEKYIEFNF